jgi:formate-dependent nitrite reductase cytochrome c552 subunit
VTCEDCHQAATTAGGTRYSVHDHKFDFSQPPVACGECHEAGDERLGKTPVHQWNIQPVKFPKPLTLEENCRRCHGDKEAAWIQENLKKIQRRL